MWELIRASCKEDERKNPNRLLFDTELIPYTLWEIASISDTNYSAFLLELIEAAVYVRQGKGQLTANTSVLAMTSLRSD